jgi:serine/threonine protein kinase
VVGRLPKWTQDLPASFWERYEFRELLGAGAMGLVFRGFEPALDRRVVVKLLRPVGREHPVLVQRFLIEARHAARTNHPAVLSLLDYGGGEYGIYMSFPDIPGVPLAQEMRRVQPPSPWRVAEVTRDLLEGLAHLQELELVHRDLKPANVLVRDDGRALILDLGLAKGLEDEESLTQTGAFLGTPAYTSPEQARGENPDPRDDLYSLGVILYEWVTGTNPFLTDSVLATIERHLNWHPPPLRDAGLTLPASLDGLVSALLAKRREDRPETAAAALAWLRNDVLPALGPAPAPRPEREILTASCVGVALLHTLELPSGGTPPASPAAAPASPAMSLPPPAPPPPPGGLLPRIALGLGLAAAALALALWATSAGDPPPPSSQAPPPGPSLGDVEAALDDVLSRPGIRDPGGAYGELFQHPDIGTFLGVLARPGTRSREGLAFIDDRLAELRLPRLVAPLAGPRSGHATPPPSLLEARDARGLPAPQGGSGSRAFWAAWIRYQDAVVQARRAFDSGELLEILFESRTRPVELLGSRPKLRHLVGHAWEVPELRRELAQAHVRCSEAIHQVILRSLADPAEAAGRAAVLQLELEGDRDLVAGYLLAMPRHILLGIPSDEISPAAGLLWAQVLRTRRMLDPTPELPHPNLGAFRAALAPALSTTADAPHPARILAVAAIRVAVRLSREPDLQDLLPAAAATWRRLGDAVPEPVRTEQLLRWLELARERGPAASGLATEALSVAVRNAWSSLRPGDQQRFAASYQREVEALELSSDSPGP